MSRYFKYDLKTLRYPRIDRKFGFVFAFVFVLFFFTKDYVNETFYRRLLLVERMVCAPCQNSFHVFLLALHELLEYEEGYMCSKSFDLRTASQP